MKRKSLEGSKRIFLESSELIWAEYDADYSLLTVEFVSSGIYRYAEVPLAEVDGLLAAESKGRYFNAHIRERYAYERLS